MTINDDPLMRPVSGKPGQLEPIPRTPGELHIWGEALIKNGDTVIRARNKIVGQGLAGIVALLGNGVTTTHSSSNNGNFAWPPLFETNQQTRSRIRVGTGTGATADGTTALVSETATAADSTAETEDNPSSGVYRVKFTATWNAGTIAAVTVTEIGIFGFLRAGGVTQQPSNTGVSTWNGTANSMFARLSSTDSEFTSFLINTAAPLTIEYRIVFTFT